MTTTLTKPEPEAERPLSHRIPTVAANLLPLEVFAARRTRRIRRLVILVVALVVVALLGWYGFALVRTSLAEDELARAKDETIRLENQQNAFAELQQVRRDSQAVKQQLEQLMVSDLSWGTLVGSLRQAAPSDLLITGITGTLDATRANPGPGARVSTGPVALATITGIGTSKPQVAAYVDALAKLPGVADPFITSVTAGEQGLDFTVQINVTDALLGGRYAKADK